MTLLERRCKLSNPESQHQLQQWAGLATRPLKAALHCVHSQVHIRQLNTSSAPSVHLS